MSNLTVTLNTVSTCVNYVLGLPMLIIGTIGGLLTVIVFTRQDTFLRNPTVNYLLAGAIMTAIHLPLSYTQSILIDGFGINIMKSGINVCRQFNYLLYVTTVPAISFPCWAAFDQYASTSRRASFRNRWSSVRVARLAIIGTVLFTVVIYIPIILYSGIVNGSCVILNDPYKYFNSYFLTPFLFTIAPLILVVGFTCGTIRNLRLSTINNQHNHVTKQIRRMLIPQLVLLSISGIPYGLLVVYTTITSKIHKNSDQLAIERLSFQLIRLFYHLNYASTFFIYLYKSKEVRKILRKMIPRSFQKNRVVAVTTTSVVHFTNRKTQKSVMIDL